MTKIQLTTYPIMPGLFEETEFDAKFSVDNAKLNGTFKYAEILAKTYGIKQWIDGNYLLTTFSITPKDTCVGSTPTCRSLCYACRGPMAFKHPKTRFLKNWEATRHPHFVTWAVNALKAMPMNVRFSRIHVAGDFYEPAYVQKWQEIAEQVPQMFFMAYTRSWSQPDMVIPLIRLARTKNVHIMASIDKDNYQKFIDMKLQKYFDIAVLMQGKCGVFDAESIQMMTALETAGIPKSSVIIFRDFHMRKVEMKAVGRYMICPAEQKEFKAISCGACRLCYDRPLNKVHETPIADAGDWGEWIDESELSFAV